MKYIFDSLCAEYTVYMLPTSLYIIHSKDDIENASETEKLCQITHELCVYIRRVERDLCSVEAISKSNETCICDVE